MRPSRCVPPAPGMIPSVVSGSPTFTCAAATRRSHTSASSRPPPNATPLSAAITGFGDRSSGPELRAIQLHLHADVVLRHALALLQIRARAERLVAAARDHDRTHRRIRHRLARQLAEREERRARQAVHPRLTVDRPHDDVAALLDLDRKGLVRHEAELPPRDHGVKIARLLQRDTLRTARCAAPACCSSLRPPSSPSSRRGPASRRARRSHRSR